VRTLRRSARVRGRALFGGGPTTLRLLPGREGWRWGLRGDRLHPLRPEDLAPLPHRSRLVRGDAVATLPEHALAALVLLDIDAVDLIFEGGEAPVGDGSAGSFLDALRAAGISGGRRSRLTVSTAAARWDAGFVPGRARTFLARADAARLRPLYPGARPGGALILDGDGALYGGRPRMPDEPAVHKLLDLLGDLGPWRAIGPLEGHLHVAAPSHLANPHAIAAAFTAGAIGVMCES
jgi:UDP-3-O-acyl-N-acetylglucosamine deacetylase